MASLQEFAASRKAVKQVDTPTTTTKEPSTASKVLSFVKNLPTTIARTVTQPVEFVEKTGASIGNYAAKKIPLKLNVSEKTKQAAQQVQSGLQKDITLPGQDQALIGGATPYTSLREFAGGALEAGLNVGTALVGGVGTGTVIKGAAKQTAKQLAAKVAKQALKDSALGAGFGLSTGLQDPNATGADIAKSTLIGAGAGALIPPVLGASTKVLRAGLEATGQKVGQALEKTALNLESKVPKKMSAIDILFSTELPKEVKPTFGQKLAGGTAKVIRGVEAIPNTIKTAVNKYNPLVQFTQKAKEAGIDTKDLGEMAQATQHIGAGVASNKLDDYIALKKEYGENWGYVKKNAQYHDFMDRIARGQDIEGGKTVTDVQEAMKNLQAALPPEQWKKVVEGTQKLQGFLNQQLDDALSSGRLNEQSYAAIKAAHPNYTPHSVLDFLDDERPSPGTGKSLNVGKNGFQKAKGSTREIDDIDNAIVQNIYRNSVLNEKNKTMSAIIETGGKNPELFGFKKLEDPSLKAVDYQRAGFEKVSYFNNGQKEDWLVPKDIGNAVKNLDGEAAGTVMRWLDDSILGKALQAPAKFTKAIATTYNPVFAGFSNPARDVQTALITTKTTPADFAKSFAKGLWGLIAGPNAEDKEFMRIARGSGALQGSIFQEGLKPEKILQKKMEKQGIFQKISHPLQAVADIGQKMEEFTRMTVFKNALKNGASLEEAAKITRNATVDFSRSGNALQVANKVVPFINARVQGFANLGRALKEDPTRFYRQMMWTSAYPTALLYQHNSAYKSYQQIPDNEKRKYWIIMVGEGQGKDISGKPRLTPNYIKIPKGEAQQAVSSILERVLNLGKEKYPDTTAEFLGKLGTDFSPVTEASILPSGFQQFAELKSNYSFFREKQIEPDFLKVGGKWMKTDEIPEKYRATETTSQIAKTLGKSLGWSPIKIDYVIKNGLLNDFIRTIDIPTKGFTGKTTFQKAAELPFARSILGTSNYGIDLQKKNFELNKIKAKNEKKLDKKFQQ